MDDEKKMKCGLRSRTQSSAFSSVRRLWSKVLYGSLFERLACATAASWTMTSRLDRAEDAATAAW